MYCEYCDCDTGEEAIVLDFERIDMSNLYFCNHECMKAYIDNHTFSVVSEVGFEEDEEEEE